MSDYADRLVAEGRIHVLASRHGIPVKEYAWELAKDYARRALAAEGPDEKAKWRTLKSAALEAA